MATLNDDCFAPGAGNTAIATALDPLIRQLVPVVGAERVGLDQSLHRIAATDIIAPINIPPHDNSAVDGYLVRFDDLNINRPTTLPIAGRIAAGHTFSNPLPPRSALKVLTGAPLTFAGTSQPPDTIFMQENCQEIGTNVVLPPGIKRGANLRRAGEDMPVGATVISRGDRLGPAEIGTIASLGLDRIEVFQTLRVAVMSTGDELRDPGDAVPPGAIYDANRYCLAAMTRSLGMAVEDIGIVPDRPEAIQQALGEAVRRADVVISSGGMSAGEEDHVRPAVHSLGGSLDFWRLAMKPGRPVAVGDIGGVRFLGLPGNPAAVMIAFLIIARPILLSLAGASRPAIDPPWSSVCIAFDHAKKAGRAEYLPVRLERDADGVVRAHRYPRAGSGILSAFAWADGIICLDETAGGARAGQSAPYCSLATLL